MPATRRHAALTAIAALCLAPTGALAGETPTKPPRSPKKQRAKAPPPQRMECGTDAPRLHRGGKLPWRQDIVRAMKDAKRLERPILIYFTADW